MHALDDCAHKVKQKEFFINQQALLKPFIGILSNEKTAEFAIIAAREAYKIERMIFMGSYIRSSMFEKKVAVIKSDLGNSSLNLSFNFPWEKLLSKNSNVLVCSYPTQLTDERSLRDPRPSFGKRLKIVGSEAFFITFY